MRCILGASSVSKPKINCGCTQTPNFVSSGALFAPGPVCIQCVSGVYPVCIWGVSSVYLGCIQGCIYDVFEV